MAIKDHDFVQLVEDAAKQLDINAMAIDEQEVAIWHSGSESPFVISANLGPWIQATYEIPELYKLSAKTIRANKKRELTPFSLANALNSANFGRFLILAHSGKNDPNEPFMVRANYSLSVAGGLTSKQLQDWLKVLLAQPHNISEALSSIAPWAKSGRHLGFNAKFDQLIEKRCHSQSLQPISIMDAKDSQVRKVTVPRVRQALGQALKSDGVTLQRYEPDPNHSSFTNFFYDFNGIPLFAAVSEVLTTIYTGWDTQISGSDPSELARFVHELNSSAARAMVPFKICTQYPFDSVPFTTYQLSVTMGHRIGLSTPQIREQLFTYSDLLAGTRSFAP